jgi:chromatin remodeling complex protein RSC6
MPNPAATANNTASSQQQKKGATQIGGGKNMVKKEGGSSENPNPVVEKQTEKTVVEDPSNSNMNGAQKKQGNSSTKRKIPASSEKENDNDEDVVTTGEEDERKVAATTTKKKTTTTNEKEKTEEAAAATSDVPAHIQTMTALSSKLTEMATKNKECELCANDASKMLKVLQKNFDVYVKSIPANAKKQREANKKAKKENTSGKPNPFDKPYKITEELRSFLGVPNDVGASRSMFTRALKDYVNEHQLKKQGDGRIIIPDEKLRALLKTDQPEINFFATQGLISKHFLHPMDQAQQQAKDNNETK